MRKILLLMLLNIMLFAEGLQFTVSHATLIKNNIYVESIYHSYSHPGQYDVFLNQYGSKVSGCYVRIGKYFKHIYLYKDEPSVACESGKLVTFFNDNTKLKDKRILRLVKHLVTASVRKTNHTKLIKSFKCNRNGSFCTVWLNTPYGQCSFAYFPKRQDVTGNRYGKTHNGNDCSVYKSSGPGYALIQIGEFEITSIKINKDLKSVGLR